MSKIKYTLLSVLIFFSLSGYGQEVDTAISFYSDSATVLIYQNPDINLLLSPPATSTRRGKAKGYRIQIYNGNDREKAKQIQINFIREHKGVAAYFGYSPPHFQIRVGDFLKRSDAQELYSKLQSKYICTIVPAIVNVRPKPTFAND